VALPYTATTGASSVLHRAAAYGRPVVTSDLPDTRAVTEEEGLMVDYVPPADPDALAQALIRLLGDPERRAALARHNLSVMRAMSPERICARYADLFQSVARAA
jgi:phosphatidylinositol alpha-mannosyltransferase